MAKVGGKKHEARLSDTIESLSRAGFRVVRLDGKSPDAIATRDGKIYAVEVLTANMKTFKRGKNEQTHREMEKARSYWMFDGLFIEWAKNDELERLSDRYDKAGRSQKVGV